MTGADVLLLKNRLRLLKGTLRHTWSSLVGILIVGGLLVYRFVSVIVRADPAGPVASRLIFGALGAVSAAGLIILLSGRTPAFRIEAASLVTTYNTAFFRRSLRRSQLRAAGVSVLCAAALALILSGLSFSAFFAEMFIILSLYLLNCRFLAWILYHSEKKLKPAVLPFYVLCTVLLLLRSPFSAAALALLLAAAVLYSGHILKLDLPKYFGHLQRLEATSAALSRSDYEKMRQLSDENRSPIVRGLTLESLRAVKRNALFLKSLLELLRLQKGTLIVFVLITAFGWTAGRTELLSSVPLLDEPSIRAAVSVLCVSLVLSGMSRIILEHAKTVSDKRMAGLSLPFTTAHIVLSYALTALILNVLLTFLFGLLYSAFSPRLLLLPIAAEAVFFFSCVCELYNVRFKRAALVIANLLLVACVSWCLVL